MLKSFGIMFFYMIVSASLASAVQFQNVSTSGYLTVSGNDVIHQKNGSGNNTQWELISAGGDVYYIKNIDNNRYLDYDTNREVDTSSNTGSDKKWRLVPAGEAYLIQNISSNRNLDADSNGVVDTSSNTGADKSWRIINDDDNPPIDPPPSEDDPDIKFLAVGQSLIKIDPRLMWPNPYNSVKPFLADADVAFTNFEMAVNKSDNGCDVDDDYKLVLGIPPHSSSNRPGNTSKPHAVEEDVMEFLASIGFNLMSLANNHSWDLGDCGVKATINAARANNVIYAGAGLDKYEAIGPSYMQVNGFTVALIAATTSNDDRIIRPGSSSPGINGVWTGYQSDWDANIAAVKEAAKNADMVVYYQHFQIDDDTAAGNGNDDHRDVGGDAHKWQEDFAKAVIDAGASIYLAHGHRGFEGMTMYKNRPIFHQLGGFAYQGRNPEKGKYDDDYAWDGLMVNMDFTDGYVRSLEFIPLQLDEGNAYRSQYDKTESDPDDISPGDTKNTDIYREGMAGFLAHRGHAEVATGNKAQSILNRFKTLSGKKGVNITINGERGYYDVPINEDVDVCENASSSGACRGTLTLSDGNKMHYFRSHPIGTGNSAVSRAIIVVHGNSNNPWGYFDDIADLVHRNNAEQSTMIIAPYFRDNEEDNTAPSGHAVWSDSGWKRGDKSKTSPRISSFAALDEIILKLTASNKFPSLQQIVVTGHSAGGQFVQRYAAGTRVEDSLGGVGIRYVAANPSSYMWLNSRRVINGNLEQPSTSCSDYNDYKYGMDGRNSYMSILSKQTIKNQFISKDVVYLVGRLEDDCECNSSGNVECRTGDCSHCESGLACSCSARLQGLNRFERAVNFMDSLDTDYPGHVHDLKIIEDIGHNGNKIFNCGEGPKVLLGTWASEASSCP